MTAGRIYNEIQDAVIGKYNYESDSQFLKFYFYDRDDEKVATLNIINDTVWVTTEDGASWEIDCYHRPMKSIIREVLEGLETRNIFPVIGTNPVED